MKTRREVKCLFEGVYMITSTAPPLIDTSDLKYLGEGGGDFRH